MRRWSYLSTSVYCLIALLGRRHYRSSLAQCMVKTKSYPWRAHSSLRTLHLLWYLILLYLPTGRSLHLFVSVSSHHCHTLVSSSLARRHSLKWHARRESQRLLLAYNLSQRVLAFAVSLRGGESHDTRATVADCLPTHGVDEVSSVRLNDPQLQ